MTSQYVHGEYELIVLSANKVNHVAIYYVAIVPTRLADILCENGLIKFNQVTM